MKTARHSYFHPYSHDFPCSLALVVLYLVGSIFSSTTALSVPKGTQKILQTYVLTPWHQPDRTLGKAQLKYDYGKGTLQVKLEKDYEDGLIQYQVPIPSQEESLASSLWPASCAATLWWNHCGPSLLPHLVCTTTTTTTEPLKILELGSGLGVTGWAVASVAAAATTTRNEDHDDSKSIPDKDKENKTSISLVLTDQDEEAVVRLAQSAQINAVQDDDDDDDHSNSNNNHSNNNHMIHVQALKLDWRDQHDQQPQPTPPFDIIVGSDICYYHFLIGPLAETVQYFFKSDGRDDRDNDDGDDERPQLFLLAAPTCRESFWNFYRLLRDGGYNVKTDEYQPPWPGTLQLLLYKLICRQSEQNEATTTTTTMAILCWTNDADVSTLLNSWLNSNETYMATDQDISAFEITF